MSSRRIPDPIVAQEARQRFQAQMDNMRLGVEASNACSWFAEHASGDQPPESVFRVRTDIVASATPGASCAAIFIRDAAQQFMEKILIRAMALAETQQADAERARRMERR